MLDSVSIEASSPLPPITKKDEGTIAIVFEELTRGLSQIEEQIEFSLPDDFFRAFGSLRPAYQFTSARPLPLDPANKVFAGAVKVPSRAAPKTPSLPTGATASGSKDKKEPAPEVLTPKSSTVDKKKGVATDLGRKRKSSAGTKTHAGDLGSKKALKDSPAPTSIIVRSSTPTPKVYSSTPSSSLPPSDYLAELPEELEGEFRKQLREVIPESEKGVGTVWKTHLPRDYPDSLGVYFPGYTNMQKNLTPTDEERIKHAREAFRVTSTAEERKLVEEDSRGALGLAMHYQHHSGVILGSLWDKYEREALRLEAPHPGVSHSTATIIERDFYKDQMLSRNHLANIRLEEIRAGKKEIENFKGTLLKQQAALTQKEDELARACARVAEVERELASRNEELGKMKENAKRREEEVSRRTLDEFLNSMAFTDAARIATGNLTKAAIYKELNKLSKIYPFDPRRCGFVYIRKEDRFAAVLPGFTWDRKKDKMRNDKGQIVRPLEHFKSIESGDIACPWKGVFQWPVDVNDPNAGWITEERVEEAEEDVERQEGQNKHSRVRKRKPEEDDTGPAKTPFEATCNVLKEKMDDTTFEKEEAETEEKTFNKFAEFEENAENGLDEFDFVNEFVFD